MGSASSTSASKQNNDCCKDSNKENSNLWDNVKETVGAVSDNKPLKYGAAAVVVVAAVPLLVTAAGFGSGGVVAGSAAAGLQSSWFGGTISGVSGYMFSGLQSIGAAGMGVTGNAVAAGTGIAAVGTYDTIKGKSKDDKAARSEDAGVQSTWFGGTISGITGQMSSGLQTIGATGLGVAGKAVAGTSNAAVGIYDRMKGKYNGDKDCKK